VLFLPLLDQAVRLVLRPYERGHHDGGCIRVVWAPGDR
jgi:hypothetical protein